MVSRCASWCISSSWVLRLSTSTSGDVERLQSQIEELRASIAAAEQDDSDSRLLSPGDAEIVTEVPDVYHLIKGQGDDEE